MTIFYISFVDRSLVAINPFSLLKGNYSLLTFLFIYGNARLHLDKTILFKFTYVTISRTMINIDTCLPFSGSTLFLNSFLESFYHLFYFYCVHFYHFIIFFVTSDCKPATIINERNEVKFVMMQNR